MDGVDNYLRFMLKVFKILHDFGFETDSHLNRKYKILFSHNSEDFLFYKCTEKRAIPICGYHKKDFILNGELDEGKFQQIVKNILNKEKLKEMEKDFK